MNALIQVSLVKECMWKKFYSSKWVKWARKQIFLFPFKIIYIVNWVWKGGGGEGALGPPLYR